MHGVERERSAGSNDCDRSGKKTENLLESTARKSFMRLRRTPSCRMADGNQTGASFGRMGEEKLEAAIIVTRPQSFSKEHREMRCTLEG